MRLFRAQCCVSTVITQSSGPPVGTGAAPGPGDRHHCRDSLILSRGLFSSLGQLSRMSALVTALLGTQGPFCRSLEFSARFSPVPHSLKSPVAPVPRDPTLPTSTQGVHQAPGSPCPVLCSRTSPGSKRGPLAGSPRASLLSQGSPSRMGRCPVFRRLLLHVYFLPEVSGRG